MTANKMGATIKKFQVEGPDPEYTTQLCMDKNPFQTLIGQSSYAVEFQMIRFTYTHCNLLGGSLSPILFRKCEYMDEGKWLGQAATVMRDNFQPLKFIFIEEKRALP